MGKIIGNVVTHTISYWKQVNPKASFLLKLRGLRIHLNAIRQINNKAEIERNALQANIKTAKLVNYPASVNECCGKRPESFQQNLKIEQIPALSSTAKVIGSDMGFNYYVCENCGQFWHQKITTVDKSGPNYAITKSHP